LEATAIYALGLRIANTLNIIITASINSALAPVRMKKINEPGNQRFYSKALLYTALLFTYMVLALSLFSIEILKVLTNSKEYWAASCIIPILAFSLLFTSMRFHANIGLVIKKKTKIIALLIFLASGVNLGLNFVLIPLLDIYGVSIATFITQFLLFVGVAYASQRYYKIPYEWNKVVWMVVIGAVLIGAGLLLTPLTPFIRIPAKVILLILYPFLLVRVGFFEMVEIEILKGIFKAWKNPRHLRKNIERLIS
jgi:O-antigen/teichoic acid export membrane protein